MNYSQYMNMNQNTLQVAGLEGIFIGAQEIYFRILQAMRQNLFSLLFQVVLM